MIDFAVNIYERMVNFAVKFGPRLKRLRRHRQNYKNKLYQDAYRSAFSDKVCSDHAWGQPFVTGFFVVLAVACPFLWVLTTFLYHEGVASFWSGLMFWVGVIGVAFQGSYYRKIQDYAIENAQKALREQKIARIKAKEKEEKAAEAKKAQEKVAQDAARVAQLKKARTKRKAAESKTSKPSSSPATSATDDPRPLLKGFGRPPLS